MARRSVSRRVIVKNAMVTKSPAGSAPITVLISEHGGYQRVHYTCTPAVCTSAQHLGPCYGPVPGLSPLLQPGLGLDGNLNRGGFRVNYYK